MAKNQTPKATPISVALHKEARGNLADAKVAVATAENASRKAKEAVDGFAEMSAARRAKEAKRDVETQLAAARLKGDKVGLKAAEETGTSPTSIAMLGGC